MTPSPWARYRAAMPSAATHSRKKTFLSKILFPAAARARPEHAAAPPGARRARRGLTPRRPRDECAARGPVRNERAIRSEVERPDVGGEIGRASCRERV